MFTDTLTVTAASAVPAMPTPLMTPPATPPVAKIAVTVQSEATGGSFSFMDVATNAALYYIGATLTHTIAPAAATTTASS